MYGTKTLKALPGITIKSIPLTISLPTAKLTRRLTIRPAQMDDDFGKIGEFIFDNGNESARLWTSDKNKFIQTVEAGSTTENSLFSYKNIFLAIRRWKIVGVIISLQAENHQELEYHDEIESTALYYLRELIFFRNHISDQENIIVGLVESHNSNNLLLKNYIEYYLEQGKNAFRIIRETDEEYETYLCKKFQFKQHRFKKIAEEGNGPRHKGPKISTYQLEIKPTVETV